MISKISTITEYNQLFIDPIIQNTNLFLPLDQVSSDAIKNDRLNILRTIYSQVIENNEDYNNHVDTYNSQYSPLSEDLYAPLTRFENSTIACVYPFSRSNFIEKFYPNILPSCINQVFAFMKLSGRMISIGSGAGKCVIFCPDYFVEEEHSSLTSQYTYSETVIATVNINSLLVSQQADITALLKQNSKLLEEIETLKQTNSSMANARTEDYLTTWR